MSDLVIVWMHEKGFPQADFHQGCGDIGSVDFDVLGHSPDDFFTLSEGDSIEDAILEAKKCWPTARLLTFTKL